MDPVLLVTSAAVVVAVLGVVLVVAVVRGAARRRSLEADLARTRTDLAELRQRVDRVERVHPAAPDGTTTVHDDGPDDGPEYVITSLTPSGEPDLPEHPLTGREFVDVALGESLLKVAAFAHGVRRAASPENRNRIRFEMAREVKRARRQRRRDLKEARRHLRTQTAAGTVADTHGPAADGARAAEDAA